jgi:hypothetical protein
MTCVTCGSAQTAPTYVLVEHSPIEVGRMGRDKVVRRVLEPVPLQLCAPCLARVQLARKRAKIVAGIALSGVAVACGYFVGAVAGAPTAVVLALLFGGMGTFALGVVLMIAMQSALIRSLPIADNRGRNILLVTTERAELDRELDKHRLASAEIRNRLERPDDAEPLPPVHLRRD